MSYPDPVEALAAEHFDGGHHQRSIEKVIALLARGFGDQQATVAGTAQQRLMVVLRGDVKRTHRVIRQIGAEGVSAQRVFDWLDDVFAGKAVPAEA